MALEELRDIAKQEHVQYKTKPMDAESIEALFRPGTAASDEAGARLDALRAMSKRELRQVLALHRHRRRHVQCAGMGLPVLKMTAFERRSF